MTAFNSEEIFWTKVDKRGPDECWEWQGYKHERGYGMWKMRYRRQGSHRWAYQFTNGAIPDGLLVLHECDNPPCCNPKHLFLGTNDDNIRDMVSKGRQHKPVGEKHHNAKLTDDMVRFIREANAQGMHKRLIAVQFGVSVPTIYAAVDGKDRWSHV